ncbi:MAG: Glu-tRNA(Gln) amidotransferase subunit GatD [Candidatus Micrarchaeota archaeon]|nr:Glu-tRNA(Gln) amidotransferase subunit GatD [Candidatus Micrarchaeota archaeon]
METGDRISVSSDNLDVEGELMPSTEAGSPDSIIVKLDNGYNIGIDYSKGAKIKRIGAGTKLVFPKRDVSVRKGLPKVTLIYTGGTIGSKIDYKTGGVHMLIEPSELLYEVPELSDIANVEVKHLFSIASEDMSYLEWQAMAKEVEKALNGGSRGVVVTMGTDTMHYTASALAFMLHDLNAPVVVTGAQRSSDRGSSDAFFNLASAVQIAAKSDIAEVGICMHATSSDNKCAFIRGTRARKMHTSRRDAFRSMNDRPLAYVSKDLGIEYNNTYNKMVDKRIKVSAELKFESKVALIKSYPNSDPEIIDFYVGKGYKGIIIEGTGLGHVPASTVHEKLLWLGHIKNAIGKGVIVGMTSQCLYGRVNANVYTNLRLISRLGVVYCEDMLPEVALVKLGWLLGNFDKNEAKQLLDRDLKMELKKRSRFDEFLI